MKIQKMSVAVRRHPLAVGVLLSSLSALAGVQASPHDHVIDAGEVVTVPGDFGSPWEPGDFLSVGLYSAGELNILQGGQVVTGSAGVGETSTSVGTLLVSGEGSRLVATQGMTFGSDGVAQVMIEQGGVVEARAVSIGFNVNGDGVVVVDGDGSRLDSELTLAIGTNGNGDLTLRNDAHADVGFRLTLGGAATGKGILTLDGGHATVADLVTVGDLGNAQLTLENGATLSTAKQTIVGWRADSEGDVILRGADTLFEGGMYFMVGNLGDGAATLADGATLRITRMADYPDNQASLVLANEAGSTGLFNIGASEGSLAEAAGVLDVERVRFGQGDGVLVFNHTGNDYQFAPYLDGMGTVRHLAGGTVFNGESSLFSGTTQLLGGTLTLAADDALGSGLLILEGGTLATAGTITLGHDTQQLADSTLYANTDAVAHFTGALDLGNFLLTIDGVGTTHLSGELSAGTGALNKLGEGVLLLTGQAAAFTGTHVVANGALAVNTVLGGAVDVRSGGRLQGTGAVGDTEVRSGGTLAAGNSIGLLTIDGDLLLHGGSVLEVETNPDGVDSDLVHVTGTATLAGSVLHVGEAGHYRLNSRYRILTADDGLVDAFEGVTSDLLFLDADLLHGTHTVDLLLTRNDVTFTSIGHTPNQRAVGAAVEQLGDGNAVYDEIVIQSGTAADVRRSYDQLSGEVHASVLTALLEESRLLRDIATDRLRGGRAGDLTLASSDGVTGWARPYGQRGTSDGRRGTADLDRDTQGLLIGVDVQNDRLGRAGALLGISRTDLSLGTRRGDADIDSLHLGLYGEALRGALAVRGGLFYSHQQIETERRVSVGALNDTLTGKRNADTVQGLGELAYRLGDERMEVETFAQLAQLHVRLGSGSERGGVTALHAGRGNTDVTFSTVGVRPALLLGAGDTGLRLFGTVGWRHAFGDVTPDSALRFEGGESFHIDAAPLARNTVVLEAGASLSLSSRASLSLAYSGQSGGGVSDHGGHATLAWDF